ncbi:MAG: hypothetical protein FJ363_05030 [Gemmatimonadetes bacterium]|nr:hypothetical protein [Gemmatimonadota bacterium]
MMRPVWSLALCLAGATIASAQMPPSVSKPIEQARKNVAATNAQTAAANPASQGTAAAKPAPAAQAPATGAPQAKSAPQAAKPVAAPAKGAAPAPAAKDSSKITFAREVFTYVAREIDPFASPIETGAIRPLVADLKLVGVIYDPAGRNSVAVMRDVSTNDQHRAKVGQMLGRAKVSQIKPQEVVLTIDEYGFSRQEVLKLTQQQTQQTKGKP